MRPNATDRRADSPPRDVEAGASDRRGGSGEEGIGPSTGASSRRGFLGAVATAAVGASAGCLTFDSVSAVDSTEFDVGGALSVANTHGDLSVRRGDVDRVTASLTKYDNFGNEDALSNVVLETGRSGDDLSLSVADRTDDGLLHGTGADLVVVVPESVPVDAIAADHGDLVVEGVRGDIDATVDDADVEAAETDGDLTLSVDDGDVTAEAVGGDVDVTGDDGDVRIDGADGTATVEVDDGDVEIAGVSGIDQVRADDGDVDLSLDGLGSDGIVEADAGDVSAALPSAVDGRVVARTDNGDITTEGLDADIMREGEGTYVEADFGGEESRLLVDTDSGDIELTGRE